MKAKLTPFFTFSKGIIFVFCSIILLSNSLNAQVVINEFSASNRNDYFDNFSDNSDWIELYNSGSSVVNLSGYHLSDKIDDPIKWVIPNGVFIQPDDHLLINASGEDVFVGGNLHANFKLTQMKQEYVIFADPDGNIVDAIQMTLPAQTNHSRGRIIDGAPQWGVFLNPTPGASNFNASEEYAQRPVLDMEPGFYENSVTVSVFAVPGDEIRYTTDGEEPTTSDVLYTTPLTITQTTCLKVKAYSSDPNVPPSFTETNTYFINEEHTLPVFSISSQEVSVLLSGSDQGEHITHLEYFNENKEHEFEMLGHFKSHGNDSWAYAQRGIRFYVKDYYGYAHKVDYQLFPSSDRTDFDVFILKASASDNYPHNGGRSCHMRDAYVQTLSEYNNLNLDSRKYRRVIMYVNGEYWGLYELRERVDADYTKYYHDQGEKWVDMLEYWGGMSVRYGSQSDWNTLYNFMVTSDLSVPANFDYVRAEFDLSSLIDYVILNTFTVNTDWLNWNTKWWRGRKTPATGWRYSLWDMDNTFNLGQNFTGLPTTGWQSDPCDVEDLFNGNPNIGHIEMLQALFANEEFVQMYINRYADLASTVFTCDNMLGYFDEMVAEMEPEMQRQIDRWGGSWSDWQENLEDMRSEIENKCVVITNQVVDCYQDQGISGPYNLMVNVDPIEGGKVQINTAVGATYPWFATYFGGVTINLNALPSAGYQFDHWEVQNNVFSPNQTADAISMSMITGDTVIAFFIPDCGIDLEITGPETICEGLSATLEASEGFASYQWSNNATGQAITVNAAGTYTVTVTTDLGCTSSADFILQEDLFAQVAIEGITSICEGNSTVLNAGAGFQSYTWSTGSTTPAISVSVPGNYSVTVTSPGGCTSFNNIIVVEIEDITTEEDVMVCYGETFQGVTYFLDTSISDTYEASNGCDSIHTIFIEVIPEITIEFESSGTCGIGGTIQTIIGGGTGNYFYQWSNGATTSMITNLETGTYILTVTDNEGCMSVAQEAITSVPNVSFETEVTLPTCAGDEDGSIVLEITSGEPPFEIMWADGSMGTSLEEIGAGSYSVFVTDANGCNLFTTVQVGNPAPVNATINTTTATPGGNEGTASALAFGGTSPYTYQWSTGATSVFVEDLAIGFYGLTITDSNGCIFETEVEIAMTVSTRELESLLHAQLFPNPSNGRFTVQLEFDTYQEVELQVMDISGKIMQSFKQNGHVLHFDINIQEAPVGTYLVAARFSDGVFVEKVVVLK